MNTYMNLILEQRFFRLLSEYSQRKVSASREFGISILCNKFAFVNNIDIH